ncbi:hypothetical protein KCP76_05310 [Salmonella enterica subsp. enterica serovar Weltevreden]|nr:hypothetical protein KCP76_05310 [Salmonella enterica subsp. enterica serovar Weltevreden]
MYYAPCRRLQCILQQDVAHLQYCPVGHNYYYDVNELHIGVCPTSTYRSACRSCPKLVKAREAQGQRLPALFTQLPPDPAAPFCVQLTRRFKRARESYGYNGDYFASFYPIKVNQHRPYA